MPEATDGKIIIGRVRRTATILRTTLTTCACAAATWTTAIRAATMQCARAWLSDLFTYFNLFIYCGEAAFYQMRISREAGRKNF